MRGCSKLKLGCHEGFEVAAEGECGDHIPLHKLGMMVEILGDAEEISSAAYDRLTTFLATE